MMPPANTKRSHASPDMVRGHAKAQKIRGIIETERKLAGSQILEVGAGAGIISQYLAEMSGPDGSLAAVDVVDQRVASEGYDFRLITGTTLPFDDASFDIVVSNHVIEHVGPEPDQLNHLHEIRRVLRSDGLLYLAVPNRWTVIEPHYRLPFLSWLPRPIADLYLQRTRSVDEYDCWPPGPRQIRKFFAQTQLSARNMCSEAVRLAATVETGSRLEQIVGKLPKHTLQALTDIMPSLIFLAKRSANV
jgi:2-polyprenyl-3-methyl-5-hydroxy-6-metoxy-1,4-benzoquinol methylase